MPYMFKNLSEPLVNNLSIPKHRSCQQQGVYPVQNAAMAREQRAGILDANRTFESRLGQIAHLRGHIHQYGQSQPIPKILGVRELRRVPLRQPGGQVNQAAGSSHATRDRAQRALPGLVGTQRWRQLESAQTAAYVESADVSLGS